MAEPIFNSAFGGGLRSGAALADLLQQRQQRSQLQQLAQMASQPNVDYQQLGAGFIGAGLPGQGMQAMNVPYARQQDALQGERWQQTFDANEAQRGIQNALARDQFAANQAYRNSSLEIQRRNAARLAAQGNEGPRYSTTPQLHKLPSGELRYVQFADDGSYRVVDDLSPAETYRFVDTGTGTQAVGNKSGAFGPALTKDNRGKAYGTAVGTAEGKADAEFAQTADENIAAVDRNIQLIDQALTHPGLAGAVGMIDSRKPDWMVGQQSTDFRVLAAQLRGNAFLQAYESLKGGGPITDIEGQKAEAAQARLNEAQSEGAYKQALGEMRTLLEQRKAKISQRQQKLNTTQNGVSWEAVE